MTHTGKKADVSQRVSWRADSAHGHLARWPLLVTVIVSSLAQAPNPAFATPSTAHTPAIVVDSIKRIRDDLAPQIRSVQKRHSVPGLSLIAIRGQDTLWTEGFGYADKSGRRPATPRTLYRAGSLAKPLTAIAVMQLEATGKIDIDRPIKSYLPQLSIRSRFDTPLERLTVRSILTHHSGLPADLNKGMWSTEPFTSVATRLSEEYLAFPPNTVFSYSNLGYTLLGHMVERVSGLPYCDYMERKLFERWNMRHTGMRLRTGAETLLAKGYRDGKEFQLLPIRDLPAQGLYTSAEDLGIFMRALLSPHAGKHQTALPEKALQEMFEPQNLDVPLDLDVILGLGWFLEQGSIPGAGRVIRHGGTTLAFSSELILLPDQDLGVAVLANSQDSRAIVARLAEEILTRLLQQDAAHTPPSKSLRVQIERDIEEAQLAEMAGSYATDFGLIAIRPENEELCACIVDKTFEVIPYPDGWFGISKGATAKLPSTLGPLGDLRFQTQVIDEREVLVAENGDRQTVLGEKIPVEPVPEAWVARAGDYELLNPDKDFPLTEPRLQVRETDGQLCMSYKMPLLSDRRIQVPLRPISDSEAIILGLGRTRGETLRAIQVDGEEHLRYSGFVGRKRAPLPATGLQAEFHP